MSDVARDARRVAVEALMRIDGGAYANLVLDGMLQRANLSPADRGFVTELVYGVTRMQRACDWLVDRFLIRAPDSRTRAVLRLGAYQLVMLDTPPHAAVNATVAVAPSHTRGLVNAVLRRVADAGVPAWPSPGVELSYPDWIVERLRHDLGEGDAMDALRAMNERPHVTTRADGYVQDLASQWVASAVGAGEGEMVLDLCAGPGGKATGMAAGGATVVAMDVRETRARLVAENARGYRIRTLASDGTRPAVRAGFDHVLVDAPCSGLGVLRRRPDARWRITADDVGALAALQQRLLSSAASLVRPGGTVTYSVCTLTTAETTEVDDWLLAAHPSLVALDPPGAPWRVSRRGALLLPQATGTDGMFMLRLRAAS